MPVFPIRHRGAPGSSFGPEATGFAVKDEAREVRGEPVIVKEVNSAFIGTDLEQRLRAAEIRRVVICGATTNHCVETSTRMAGNLGFDTYIARDATWTFDLTGPDGRVHSAEDIQSMTEANLSEIRDRRSQRRRDARPRWVRCAQRSVCVATSRSVRLLWNGPFESR